jgi:hypothetical protein
MHNFENLQNEDKTFNDRIALTGIKRYLYWRVCFDDVANKH